MWLSGAAMVRVTDLLKLLILMTAVNSAVQAERLSTEVIIIGAGVAGIMAGRTLSENGLKDFVILEATDRVGGRVRTKEFAGIKVELGANWVEGVNGNETNPIWALAQSVHLRTFFSDYSNLSSNVYTVSLNLLEENNLKGHVKEVSYLAGLYDVGPVPPQSKMENVTTTSNAYLESLGTTLSKNGKADISVLTAERLSGSVPTTPVEMVLDYFLYDGEFAEPPRVTSLKNTQPLPTFVNFGPDSYFVADQRGFAAILEPLSSYMRKEKGVIIDSRLKLKTVVNKIKYSKDGVEVFCEDGSIYSAKAAILTVSLGVLQSNLISFEPDLPFWKIEALFEFDMAIYTKIFLKFPRSFWPTGAGTEFFLFADDKRGYYPIWQHLDSEYPDAHIVFVTVTDDESRRIEQQSDNQTETEVMAVLRSMFGSNIPDPEALLVPRWWSDRFFRGTFSNWPIGVSHPEFKLLQAPIERLYFSGEHTSVKYNGYVHGAFYSGIDSAKAVLKAVHFGAGLEAVSP